MIKCNSCGKDVSEGTKFCPDCGSSIDSSTIGAMPIDNSGKNNTLGIIIGAVVFIIAFAISFNAFSGNKDSNSSSNNGGSIFGEKKEEQKEENKIGTIGKDTINVKSTYSDDDIEIEVSVDDIYTADSVYPKKPYQSFYYYYPSKEDNEYLVAILNVKNLGSEDLDTSRVFSNFLGDNCSLKATFDGKYDYSGFVVGLDKDENGKYDLDSYYYIKPLKTAQIYVIFNIADEVKDKPATINFCVGDKSFKLEK